MIPNRTPNSSPELRGKDVVVVGGSAAGLYTAALLAQGGKGVCVLEAEECLAPAPRTLIVTHHLRALLGRAADASVVNEIRRFELYTDGRSAAIPLAQPDLIIERARLIRALAEKARATGVSIDCGRRFVSLAGGSRHLSIEIESCGKRDELRAPTVVGADGAASRVAGAAGWPPLETVPLIQAIVRPPKDCRPDTVRVWFVPNETPYFYWLIPESSERAALGLIAEGGRDAYRCLARFLERRAYEPLEFQAARIPVYRSWVPVRRAVGGGYVYLVGDSAAQVKVTTVGGVVTGFRGARGVAETILSGGRSPMLGALRRELGLHWLVRRALHHFQQADYSRLVDLLDGGARQSLAQVTRDEAARLLWNVIRRQPRLALLGLRGLLLGGVRRRT